MSNILHEADAAVSGARQAVYGSPAVNLSRIASMWSTYVGRVITPRDVAIMMILVKASREVETPLRDNLVDIAGYARCAELATAAIGGDDGQ